MVYKREDVLFTVDLAYQLRGVGLVIFSSYGYPSQASTGLVFRSEKALVKDSSDRMRLVVFQKVQQAWRASMSPRFISKPVVSLVSQQVLALCCLLALDLNEVEVTFTLEDTEGIRAFLSLALPRMYFSSTPIRLTSNDITGYQLACDGVSIVVYADGCPWL
ncbi:hypothetical protein PM082_001907 [Marasmius tenuissimus]|nr:hypothetical protein PM082_001907 [Marasmius tenuissimus]